MDDEFRDDELEEGVDAGEEKEDPPFGTDDEDFAEEEEEDPLRRGFSEVEGDEY